MSIEAVNSLIQAAGEDTALQQKLEAAQGFADVVKIGAEKGYQFTEQEVQAFLIQSGITLEGMQGGELSEDLLDAVAGGSFWDGKWTDNVRINLRGW